MDQDHTQLSWIILNHGSRSYEEKWTKIAALGFSVFLDIFSGFLLLFVNYHYSKDDYASDDVEHHFFMVSSLIISITLVWLIQLLICSAIASKSIRNITAQRIPLILEHPAQNSWKAVEDQVLRSWIVLLACSPESIVARSVLASSAALAVTICILTSLAGWIAWFVRPRSSIVYDGWPLLPVIVGPELIFILIGWAVISWRYLTSLAYYPTCKTDTWGKYFRVEPIWTSHIEKKKEELHLLKPSDSDQKINKIIATEEAEICNLGKRLLKCSICLQKTVVVFSKGCWWIAETFYNRFLRSIASVMFSYHIKKVDQDFEKYKAVLKRVHILGGTPRSVFATNRKSIKRAKELMGDGYNHGKECDILRKFLEQNMSSEHMGTRCLDPENSQTAGTHCLDRGSSRTGLNYVCKLGPCPALGVEKYFMYMKKQSWKLTAVSLINIIFRLSPESGEAALKAYSQALELMDLVENYHPETDRLLSKAADRLFKTLQSPQNAPSESFPVINTMERAAEEIKKLAEESAKPIKTLVEERTNEIAEQIKSEAAMICNVQDNTVDWENIAARTVLYKLCMSIDCRSGEFTELMKELESSLADIIADCIKKVGAALVDNCIKWAQDLEERKLLKAVYIAGKSKGIYDNEIKDFPN